MALLFNGLQFLDDTSLSPEELRSIKDILNPENAPCLELPWDVSLLRSTDIIHKDENGSRTNSFHGEQNFISQYTLPSQHVPLPISQSEIAPQGGINAETGVPIPIVPPCVTYSSHPAVPYSFPYQVELPIATGNVALTRPDMVQIQQIQPEVSYASHLTANQEASSKQKMVETLETTLTNTDHTLSSGNKYPKGVRSSSEVPEKSGVPSAESVPVVTASSVPGQLSQAAPSTVPFICPDSLSIAAQAPGYPRLPSFPFQTPQVIYAAQIYNLPFAGCIPTPASTIPNTTTMASPTNNEWVNSGHNVLPIFPMPNITTSEITNDGWTNNEQNRLPNVSGNSRHVAPPLINAHYNQVENPSEVSNECKNVNFVMDQKLQINARYDSNQVQSSVDGQNECQHASTTESAVSNTKNDEVMEVIASKEGKSPIGDNSWDENNTNSVSQPEKQSTLSSTSSSTEKKFTWADLFKEEKCNSFNSGKVVPPASTTAMHSVNSPVSAGKDVTTVASVNEDEMVGYLQKLLPEIKINHTAPCLKPRGLINRRNWCYINATLQALIACPPFYNLLKSLPADLDKEGRKSCTPIMDSLVKFVHEFPEMQKRNSYNKEDFPVGTAFEPIYIYKMLSVINSVCVKGQQEDAEEFLSCILNGLHEEMLAVMKGIQKNASDGHEGLPCAGYLHTNGNIVANGDLAEENDEDSWQLIGRKNKSMVTRTAAITPSPISEIFGGEIKSILTAASKQSAFIQPFFTLQLDIQAEKVDSVSEALSHLIAKEPIQGYTCTKTKQEIEAFKSFLLEKLPPIFILHFKRFVYDKDGGSKKVVKKMDYPIELELGKELLSPDVKRMKHLHSYKLIAVVYHDGEETVKGHYVADIFHCESDNWLRCDDRNISVISEAQVLRHSPPCVPYLLFYRNVDTICGPAHSK